MKFLALLGLFTFSCSAFSAPMSENMSICYKFSKNKLIEKSRCIVSTGYGAGGSYVTLEQGKSTYNVEIENHYDKKTDSYEEGDITINDVVATYYYRNLSYKRITDKRFIHDDSLNCFLAKNKKIDICYKPL